ncbi:hypothetical protein RMATCC62417_12928 [Rhizopus microsporus]|nr:hypothetical protein RMATCC62417_12928 [Rhizopus microsporus]
MSSSSCFSPIKCFKSLIEVLSLSPLFNTGDEEKFKGSIAPANFAGVYSQSSEERFGTKTCARIPWVYLQQQVNADQCATEDNVQTDVKDQITIQRTKNDLLMSLNGKSLGKDYSNDFSHWRSAAENPVSTARFSNEFTETTIQLGEAMPIICPRLKGTTMHSNGLPIKIDTDIREPDISIHIDTSDTGWGITSKEVETREFWSEAESDTSISARELKTILFALQLHARKFRNSLIHVTETCEEVWGDSIRVASDAKFRNTASHHDQSTDGKILSYTGSQECSGELPQQKEETTVRMDPSKALLPNDSTTLGQNDDRRVCYQREQTTGEVLEFSTGSSSSSNRYFPSTMVKEGTIPSSSIEVNLESYKKITGRQGYKGSDGNTNMEQPILVANGHTSEYRQTNKDPIEQDMAGDRMAIIRAYQANKGISDLIVEFLRESNWPSMLTKKNKQIKGALMCVNPKCVTVKSGKSTKSRDALSSLAIGLSGLTQCSIGSPPSHYLPNLRSVNLTLIPLANFHGPSFLREIT